MSTRALISEFTGTALLVFFAVGAAVLAGDFIGTVGIALAFGFVLLALCYALGPVSGCHVNPAVTLGMYTAGRIDLRSAVGYWVAQVLGCIVGAAVLFLLAKQVPGLETHAQFGTNGFADRSAVELGMGGAFLAEVVLTFLLVFIVLAVTNRLAVIGFDGLPIGLALAAIHIVGIPLTGTSVNPARSLGPALFAGGAAITQLWLFILAPLIGGALAALAHRFTHPPGGRPVEADAVE
ncbi:MIP family channel protein [Streptomyces sp. CHA1]|uniref:MIP family channel protein n=1 Tax=Streptomyces TaxID=1883 RepID=UPI0003C31183|nr:MULTISPECIES: MIP family channel protein [Streptomyces]QPA02056.1 MIP family channel protein [Streptomyces violascens]WDV33588.1 MIP family channel protein [Streptomyces sp. AD16]ESP96621.1 Aquaporin Z [Streptomyces sp. GBA 94-10 4N24]ESQ02464.1 Aquaporin Z [Streptomyces sp. PVA_94-07]MBT3156529.1 MIP family channel protein [Streptomyces sp. G11C]